MDFDEEEISGFSLQLFDDVWGSWNQCNDLSLGRKFQAGRRLRHQDGGGDSTFTEVYDADFKHLYEVPSHLIVHAPSARLNITRLVFCRNYRPHEPDSCKMRDGCKFVHADVDISSLKSASVHVNYIWSSEDLCTYEHLPLGEVVEVLSSDMSTVESIPSERILVTCGALARHETVEPLIRCKYFEANQMCLTGRRCCYIHVMCVDPNVRENFKRAPKVHIEANCTAANALYQPSHHSKNKTNVSNTHENSRYLDGSSGLRVTASSWVPNANSSFAEPVGSTSTGPTNGTHGTLFSVPAQGMSHPPEGVAGGAMAFGRTMSFGTAGGGQSTQSFSLSGDASECNLQGILQKLRTENNSTVANACSQNTQLFAGADRPPSLDGSDNGSNKAVMTQEQLTGVLSQVVSFLAQKMASPRTITVGMSPLLDEPHAMGTLLFLPRGGTEAMALQSVYDSSFLGVVTALGLQQQRPAAPSTSSAQPHASWVPARGGGV